VANRGWDDETKRRALEIAERESISKASAVTGVPAGTIKRWRSEGQAAPPASDTGKPRSKGQVVPMRPRGSRTEPNRTPPPNHEPPPPPPRRRPGRPTKLTSEVQEAIVSAIRAGNYMETAAAYAGIAKGTFYEWLRRGRRAKSGRYRAFVDAVEIALAEAEVQDLQRIEDAAKNGVWQAAAWRLERKFPEKWGRQGSAGSPGGEGPVPEDQLEEITATITKRLVGVLREVNPDAADQLIERLSGGRAVQESGQGA